MGERRARCVPRCDWGRTLRQPHHLDLLREAELLNIAMPEEAFHQLTNGEEQVLLGYLTRIFKGSRAVVSAGAKKPVVQRRSQRGAHEVAAHLERAIVVGQEDAKLRQRTDQIQPIEDAVVL